MLRLLKTSRDGRRVIGRLPVPKPLPHAVAAGHFGKDKNGPVSPSANEVREITFNHAEKLIELLVEQREASRGPEAHVTRLSGDIEEAVAKYAEDFGFAAAQQLLAYARRQMLIQSRETGPSRSKIRHLAYHIVGQEIPDARESRHLMESNLTYIGGVVLHPEQKGRCHAKSLQGKLANSPHWIEDAP
jgi:hypothetical protein